MTRTASTDLKNFFTLADPDPSPDPDQRPQSGNTAASRAKTDDRAKSRRRPQAAPYDLFVTDVRRPRSPNLEQRRKAPAGTDTPTLPFNLKSEATMRSLLWVLAGGNRDDVSGCGASRRRDLGWTAYKNARFGLQMRYPAGRIHPPADVGGARRRPVHDGRWAAPSSSSARLKTPSGIRPASYQRFIARESYPGFADRLRAGGCRLVGAVGHARRNDDLRESDVQLRRAK